MNISLDEDLLYGEIRAALRQNERERQRSVVACRNAIRLITLARRSREQIAGDRLTSQERRLMRLAVGGSDGSARSAPSSKDMLSSAQAAILDGRIPSRRQARTWGGPSSGAECAVCEQPIAKSQVEVELEFATDGKDSEAVHYHVHFRCFTAWDAARGREETGGGTASLLTDI